MVDYSLRAVLYDNGYIQDFKKLRFYARYLSFHQYYDASNDVYDILLEMYRSDPVAFDEARRAAASDRNRNARLKNKIRKMLSAGDCVFLTLTFTDEVLQSTTAAQRRLYVVRFLKSQSKEYIANIDFGSTGGREHYHSCLLGRVDPKSWYYGNLDCRRIVKASDPCILAHYIGKLCMHAIKETTKRSHIIYSRKSPD